MYKKNILKKSSILLIVFISIFFSACSLKVGDNLSNNSLEDTKWELTSVKADDNDPKVILKVEDRKAVINFEKDSRVFGNLGCNNFFGTYKQKDNSLEIGQVGSTMMMCQDMIIEQAFVKALQNVKTYKVKENSLIFFDEKNIEIAKFIKE